MYVQICDTSIPDGYTYERCDRFTPAEFIEMYTDKDGNICRECIEYMTANPKGHYTFSDQMEIRENAKKYEIGSLISRTGRETTKRYSYDYDKWRG